ncbi:MAG: MBL fold metallo-hydrolase [Patescibacteria group bacterium]
MRITFYGACREVTGSCYYVETSKARFLVDCGMFQGNKFAEDRNHDSFPFDLQRLDFVILTHAHIDHCGRLPKLYKDGFRGKIYATAPTRDFAKIILEDTARIIFQEALTHGQIPFYQVKDVDETIELFETLEYREIRQLTAEIKIRLRDAGHILGSAIIELWCIEDGVEKKIVFSGDLGNPPVPLVEDTEVINEGTDFLVMESTYGAYKHEPNELRVKLLRQAIVETISDHGVLLIPSFALERTQEILYELNSLVENKKIPAVPIFVDSPLAIRATDIYKKYADLYDRESRDLIERGDDLFNFPGLRYTLTTAESRQIRQVPQPKVIIAGSGMCMGGRIMGHLKNYLSDRHTHLLIIAFQVQGSLGQQILKGQRFVYIDGQKFEVQAKVSAIGAYSAHADNPKLVKWVKQMKKQPRTIFITHGEENQAFALSTSLRSKLKSAILVPYRGDHYDL